jgi:hypothetical protein
VGTGRARRARSRSGQQQGSTDELAGATRRAQSKAIGGGAHPRNGSTCGGGAAMSNSGGGAPVMGGISGMVLQCWGRREMVRRMPIESHDAWRTDSPRRRKIDVGGGSDVRW